MTEHSIHQFQVRIWSILAIGILLGAVSAQAQDSPGNQKRERIVKLQRVFVRSTSLLVRAAVVEDKLLKNSEFKQQGFVITRDPRDADLLLELRHDLLTMYVFTDHRREEHDGYCRSQTQLTGRNRRGKSGQTICERDECREQKPEPPRQR
jgi:hypothetical protein